MFLQQLVNGLMLGSVYALIALGYTMVYGVMKFINFAHGDVYMWGAFFGLLLARYTGPHFLVILPLVMLLTGLLGAAVEKVAYRPLRKAPRLVVTTSAIGMSIVLSNLALLLIGSETFPLPAMLPVRVFHIGNALINTTQILVLGTALLLMAILYWFINRSRYGKAIRAASEDRETAGLQPGSKLSQQRSSVASAAFRAP